MIKEKKKKPALSLAVNNSPYETAIMQLNKPYKTNFHDIPTQAYSNLFATA